MKKYLGIITIFCATILSAQPTPALEQSQSILLKNITLHIGNGEKMENAAIGFDKGKISYVGTAANAGESSFQIVEDHQGAHIYPGFIAPNTTLGLQEIGAVRASRDQREVGNFKPHVRSQIAYNTDSYITPTVRTNGVLMGQICPRGGRISGTSSVMSFDAWNWEDAVYREDDGIHLNWPGMFRWNWEKGTIEKNKNYDKEVREIKGFFTTAISYSQKNKITDLKMEAMKGLFDGSKSLYVHEQNASEILHIIQIKEDLGIENFVLVGGRNSWKILDVLKENNVSVIIQKPHSLPGESHHDVDQLYKLAAMLHDAGIKFCFQYSGGMEQMNTRNLPFLAGTAVAYGLPYEAAVKALTLSSAEILGIDKSTGSLETGKDATLFVSTGDALDIRSNNVVAAFIQGRKIDLTNHQTELYEKYKMKYED